MFKYIHVKYRGCLTRPSFVRPFTHCEGVSDVAIELATREQTFLSDVAKIVDVATLLLCRYHAFCVFAVGDSPLEQHDSPRRLTLQMPDPGNLEGGSSESLLDTPVPDTPVTPLAPLSFPSIAVDPSRRHAVHDESHPADERREPAPGGATRHT